MVVKNIEGNWCLVSHETGKKIKCFGSGESGKEKAMAMHRAILISQAKQRGDAVDVDALYRDQLVTKEGVLIYHMPDGTEVRMVKKWDDLKQNIGRILPITVEHPDPLNGNKGLHDLEDIVGYIGPLRQYQDKHILIGDKYVDDEIDPLNGQSVGFSYIPIVEDGEINNEFYDQVQSDLWLDHLALTRNPREPFALHTENPEEVLQLAALTAGGDSQDRDKTALRTKYWVGYDNIESLETISNQPSKKIKNVDSSMSEKNISEKEAELQVKLAKMEAERDAAQKLADSLKVKEKELKAKDAELEKVKQEADALKNTLQERVNQEVAAMSDSIVKSHGLPEDFTDKKDEKYIRGAFDALNWARENWSFGSDASQGKPVPKPKPGKEEKVEEFWYSTIDAVWSHKKKCMVDPKGNPAGTTYNAKTGEVIQLG